MGETKWTKDQLSAIETRGCNLLVAAAAGSGKTAVLVQRIINKITDEKNPVDIDRLLIVTFTSAAAAEMRERIGAAIETALENNPGDKNLSRQLTLINKATITTIHSFCLEVIKNHFHLIDLDPQFRIANETEATLLKLEALEELFEEKYEGDKCQPEFLQLVECYGGNKDDLLLQDMVLKIYHFVQSSPWPDQWLKGAVGMFDIKDNQDLINTPWAQILIKDIKIELEGCLENYRSAIEEIKRNDELDKYLTLYQEEYNAINDVLASVNGDWDSLNDALTSIDFKRLPTLKGVVDKEKQDEIKAIRDDVKKRIKKLADDVFSSDSNVIIEDLKNLYPLMDCLSRLVLDFSEKYSSKKRQKSLLDFNDLEHYCLSILINRDDEGRTTPSDVALSFREKFEEIMIDEYQDSNDVQEELMTIISRQDTDRPNIFMVGDVKQSIYRFRLAKPQLFMDKYNRYSLEEKTKERKILLYKNFRSREEVINASNYIFKQVMSLNIGEIDYDDKEALNLGADFKEMTEAGRWGGPVEVHIIEKKLTPGEEESMEGDEEENPQASEMDNNKEDHTEDEKPDNIQLEARMVGNRIRELIENKDEDKRYMVYDRDLNKYRPVEYRDIVILLRSTVNWAPTFVEELAALGIPAYADGGSGYFKTVEIQTMMSLLQIIDNPMQDIPLLGVLRSPITSFSPDELIDIRVEYRDIAFYQAMKNYSSEFDNDTGLKARDFLNNLQRWREKALYYSTDQLIWFLYHDTGYFSYVGALPGGIQRQANLRILFERARQYEETSYKGLFNFVNFINKLQSSKGDMGSAKTLGEKENVVRIMSIHKSKGLEFPVVFVSGMGKQFNLQDMNKSILLHQDLGFGPDYVDYQRRISYSSLAKQALRKKIKYESLSEEMRILYVAFTRAKEKLIITGLVGDIDKTVSRWASSLKHRGQKVSEYQIIKGKSFMDWIGCALVRHVNCSKLRDIAQVGDEDTKFLVDDDSKWDIRLWDNEVLKEIKAKEDTKIQDFKDRIQTMKDSVEEGPYYQEINRRLTWEYPYKRAVSLPTKLTVTELKRKFATEFSEEGGETIFLPTLVKKPRFLEEAKGFSAAERGTILHFVMQHLDLRNVSTNKTINNQINEMVSRELLTKQQSEIVDIAKIEGFFKSDLGKRVLGASSVKREVPFNLKMSTSEIGRGYDTIGDNEDTLLLQGIIDCYFEDNDGLVLIDFKSDYIPNGDVEKIKEKYKTQMEYYSLALEKITGKRVRERYLFLFSIGQGVGI